MAIRLVLPGASDDEINQLNRELIERINARKRVFLTETMLDGRFVIRICVLNFRTHRDRMEMCLDDIRASVAEILAASDRSASPSRGQ